MAEKRKFFGTDGIRGHVNQYPMTTLVAHALGAATTVWRKEKAPASAPLFLIGRDSRRSGDMLEAAFVAGACSMGANVQLVGILPTPAVSYLTKTTDASVGVMISASHNPYHDNGIKLFGADGFKFSDAEELEIEAYLQRALDNDLPLIDGHHVGEVIRSDEGHKEYLAHLLEQWPKELSLESFHIVLDCANGAAFEVGVELFTQLGAKVTTMGVEPDGLNINEGCGALYPEQLCKRVCELGADVGIALDGDADRLIVSDEKGQVLDGDFLMAIYAPFMLKHQALPHATVVATVMSNLGLERALKAQGITLERTKVGDRYVLEKMRALGATLGGEQSGHLIFLEHACTGDGLAAAIQLLKVATSENQPLSTLASNMTRLPQVLRNVRVREKKDWTTIPAIQSAIDEAQGLLGDQGRILVRYSGTENKARVMLEGTDTNQIEQLAEQIAQCFVDELGE